MVFAHKESDGWDSKSGVEMQDWLLPVRLSWIEFDHVEDVAGLERGLPLFERRGVAGPCS